MKDLIDALATEFQAYLRVDEDRIEHTLKGYEMGQIYLETGLAVTQGKGDTLGEL